MTINLDDLGPVRPEPKRDRWGRPLIVPPNGGKPRGYTRVTTVAKTLDGGDALLPWKATLAVVGSRVRPGLGASWDALIASTGGNPWYADAASKKECKALVEQCAEAGGSADRAQIGTALHKLTELLDLGKLDRSTLPPATLADVDAYAATLAGAGVLVVPGCVETFVVLDDHEVAGTADRLYRLPDGRTVIGDVKTGASLDFSWQSITVQLAAYAHGIAYDVTSDTRSALPDLDATVGLIVHLPAGTATCSLHLVDLVAGWEMFQRSMEVRTWRKRQDLARPYVAEVADHSARRLELQARIDAVRAFDPTSVQALQVGFAQAGVPTLKQAADHTAEQLDAIDAIVTSVEARFAPFDPQHITVPPVPERTAPQGLPRVMADEGDPISDDDYKAVQQAYAATTSDVRARVNALAAEALAAGLPFRLSERKVVRRFELFRLALAIGAAFDEDPDGADELVRAVVASIIGEDWCRQPSFPLGAVVGALTIDEARTVAAWLGAPLTARIDAKGQLLIELSPAA